MIHQREEEREQKKERGRSVKRERKEENEGKLCETVVLLLKHIKLLLL
jgi:hypothetical protein